MKNFTRVFFQVKSLLHDGSRKRRKNPPNGKNGIYLSIFVCESKKWKVIDLDNFSNSLPLKLENFEIFWMHEQKNCSILNISEILCSSSLSLFPRPIKIKKLQISHWVCFVSTSVITKLWPYRNYVKPIKFIDFSQIEDQRMLKITVCSFQVANGDYKGNCFCLCPLNYCEIFSRVFIRWMKFGFDKLFHLSNSPWIRISQIQILSDIDF